MGRGPCGSERGRSPLGRSQRGAGPSGAGLERGAGRTAALAPPPLPAVPAPRRPPDSRQTELLSSRPPRPERGSTCWRGYPVNASPRQGAGCRSHKTASAAQQRGRVPAVLRGAGGLRAQAGGPAGRAVRGRGRAERGRPRAGMRAARSLKSPRGRADLARLGQERREGRGAGFHRNVSLPWPGPGPGVPGTWLRPSSSPGSRLLGPSSCPEGPSRKDHLPASKREFSIESLGLILCKGGSRKSCETTDSHFDVTAAQFPTLPAEPQFSPDVSAWPVRTDLPTVDGRPGAPGFRGVGS